MASWKRAPQGSEGGPGPKPGFSIVIWVVLDKLAGQTLAWIGPGGLDAGVQVSLI